jgi:hypothetical protein
MNSLTDLRAHYDYLIKNYNNSIYQIKYYHPDDLSLWDGMHSWEELSEENACLKDTLNNKEALAKDILFNGIYDPLIAYEEDDKVIVTAGTHRLESIKLLVDRGAWGEGLIPVMIVPKKLTSANADIIIPDPIDPISLYVPSVVLDFPYDRQMPIASKYFKEGKYKIIDENVIEITDIDNDHDYWFIFEVYSYILNRLLYFHNKINPDKIKAGWEIWQ